jgi:excisionase family DNA binding protein
MLLYVVHHALMSEYLKPEELADELKISTRTVYRAVDKGELSALRVGEGGRSIRITRAGVDRWLVPARGRR